MNRRDFFKLTGTFSGGLLVVPDFLYSFASREDLSAADSCVVFVQLLGGNDGLNTFVPYQNDLYYRYRPNIALNKNEVIASSGGMGFHPALKGFSEIQQNGHLSVIQNVGYPEPIRSHFRSMEIWQTASPSDKHLSEGWLGRFLDHHYKDHYPTAAINADSIDNLALRGINPNSLTINYTSKLAGKDTRQEARLSDNPQLDFVRKIAASIDEGTREIQKALRSVPQGNVAYPVTTLGKTMEWISKLIKGGLNSKIYYTTLNGFDTHHKQLIAHNNKLAILNDALLSFYKDIRQSRKLEEVTVVVFSEFGRRVADNGEGTDHGTAAPMFIIGGNTKGKIIGSNPDLINLNEGDLKHGVDFRSVYASLLRDKFSFDPKLIGIDNSPVQGLF